MTVFEIVIVLLVIGALLTRLAQRLRAPYPAFLALAGAGLALIPGAPAFTMPPDLVLALFVAPTLLDAAFDASPRDLRDNWGPIVAGAVLMVVVTTAAVAVVAHVLVPSMGWPASITLGAIVAPPDASAATAVLRTLRPPHRVMVILEGESLFNDATALVIYRVGVAAAGGAMIGIGEAPRLLLSIVGAVAVGAVLGWVYPRIATLLVAGPGAIVMQFIGTFAIWIFADRVGLSPIVAIVAYAIVIARVAPVRSVAALRVQSYAVWDVVVFVLNVLAFIFAGLQLRPILASVGDRDWHEYAWFGAAVLLVVVVLRFAWVLSSIGVVRAKNRRFGVPQRRRLLPQPTVATGLMIAWCGMRGIVTLATALALPESFPAHGLILFAAFTVVFGTLVLQGLSLPLLLHILRFPPDRTVADEIALARARTAEAALAVLQRGEHPHAAALRAEFDARRHEIEQDVALDTHLADRRSAHRAERSTLVRLRATGEIGDDAFHAVEEEIDFAEMFVERRLERR